MRYISESDATERYNEFLDETEAACSECRATMTEGDVNDPDMCDDCYGIAHAFDDLEDEEDEPEEEELPEPPVASAEPSVKLEPWEHELLYPFGEGNCNICGDPDPDHN